MHIVKVLSFVAKWLERAHLSGNGFKAARIDQLAGATNLYRRPRVRLGKGEVVVERAGNLPSGIDEFGLCYKQLTFLA